MSPTSSAALRHLFACRASTRRSGGRLADWYEGRATCVLLGNLGDISAASRCSPTRGPTTGCSSSASCTAEGLAQWTRTLARTAVSDPSKSPFVRVTKARKVKVELDRKVRYELDGGDRSKVQDFKVKVEEGALRVRTPRPDPEERDHEPSGHEHRTALLRKKSTGDAIANARWFEWLARAGLVARGAIYGIIGVLALEMAFGAAARRPTSRARWPSSRSSRAGRSCSS